MQARLTNHTTLEESLANTKFMIDRNWTLTDLVIYDMYGSWGKKNKLPSHAASYCNRLEKAIGAIDKNRLRTLMNGDDPGLAIDAIWDECCYLREAATNGDDILDRYSQMIEEKLDTLVQMGGERNLEAAISLMNAMREEPQ